MIWLIHICIWIVLDSFFLPKENTVVEGKKDHFQGGYTIKKYSEKFRIDAIQIELSSKFLVEENVKIREKLLKDFANFFKTKLKA